MFQLCAITYRQLTDLRLNQKKALTIAALIHGSTLHLFIPATVSATCFKTFNADCIFNPNRFLYI